MRGAWWALCIVALAAAPAAAAMATPTQFAHGKDHMDTSVLEHVGHVHEAVMDHGPAGAMYVLSEEDARGPLVPANALGEAAWWMAAAGLGVPAGMLGWRRVAHRLPGAAGLGLFFARLDPERVAEHPRRRTLLRAVADRPGCSAEALRQELGWANGVFQHHLGVLVAHGRLRRVRSGNQVHLHVPGPGAGAPPSLPSRILAEVAGAPGIAAADLARRLDVRVSVLRYHALNLARQGRLTCRPDGRLVRYFPS